MKDKDDVMKLLHDLDDEAVEEIAERYPLMNSEEQKSLVDMCMKKTEARIEDSEEERTGEITVSGTEHYKRPYWYRYAASAAALVLATVGIAGVVTMNRGANSFKGSNLPEASGRTEISSVSTVIMSETYSSGKKNDDSTTSSLKPVTTVPATTTTASTSTTTVTESHTTTATTTTEENTATTTTEVMATEAVTTAYADSVPEVTTTAVTVRVPVGSWTSGAEASKKTWTFHSDGESGKLILADMGIGLGFKYEINGDTIIFHMGGTDDETPARIEWISDDRFVLYWKETGAEEHFTSAHESGDVESD